MNKESNENIMSLTGRIKEFIGANRKIELVCAFDFGKHDLKYAQMAYKDNEWVLGQTKQIGYKQDEKSRLEEQAQLVRGILEGKDLKKTAVYLVLENKNCLARRIIAPLMKRQELKEAVYWKMKDFLHFPVEEAGISFKISGKIEIGGETRDEVFAVGVLNEQVNRYLEIFKQAKVLPDAFFPLATCIEYNAEGSSPAAFLDLGASNCELIIMRGKTFVFSRSLPISSMDISRALTTTLQNQQGEVALSFEQAEALKIDHGILSGKDRPIDLAISESQALSLIRPEIEKLRLQIAHSLEYYQAHLQGEPVKKIVLLGAGSLLKGLPEFLSKELGIKVELADDARFFSVKGALKAAINNEGLKGINLLPEKITRRKERLFKRAFHEAAITAVILLLAVFFFGLKFSIHNINKRITSLDLQAKSMEIVSQDVDLKEYAGRIYQSQPRWFELGKELSNIIPANAYLEKFSFENDRITLEGVIFTKASDSESALSEILLNMEKGLFKNVTLIESKLVQDEGMRQMKFLVRCQIE